MVRQKRFPTYFEVLTRAMRDIARHGYDSAARVDYWAEELRAAAERSLKPKWEVERLVRSGMAAAFRKYVDNGAVLKTNPGVSAYTLNNIRPELHAELSRRIAASVDLITINREQAIPKAMQRFKGWATSVPVGGEAKDLSKHRVKQKLELRKSLSSLPFEERRVIIDQNAKLISAVNSTVAVNGGAIGALWHSHIRQRGYNGRPDHNARDGKFFLVRGSWAHNAGLVKPGEDGYTDDVEQPAEFPFCRCSWQFVYSLRSLPAECLTLKGSAALKAAREKLANAT